MKRNLKLKNASAIDEVTDRMEEQEFAEGTTMALQRIEAKELNRQKPQYTSCC